MLGRWQHTFEQHFDMWRHRVTQKEWDLKHVREGVEKHKRSI